MTDVDEASPGPSPGYRRTQSSRAYENLQRIGAISFPSKRKHGHRHTYSTPVATVSSLSPIPSLSSIATTATSAESSTLNTPTSTVYPPIYVRGHTDHDRDSHSVDEEDEDIPTPTPSPKSRPNRVSISTTSSTSTILVPKTNSPSIPTANFLRRLSLRRFSASSSPSPIKPPQRAKPSLAMSVAVPVPGSPRAAHATTSPRVYSSSPNDDRLADASAPSVVGLGDRRGQPQPHLQLPQASLSLNLNLRAPKPRRITQSSMSMSVPSSPLPSQQVPPSPSSQQYRPPSRSEKLLRSALLRDEFLAQAQAQNFSSVASSSSLSSSVTSTVPPKSKQLHTQTHRRRHSSAAIASASSSPPSKSSHTYTRRITVEEFDVDEEVNHALVGASFMFKSAITSTSPTSSPTRGRSSAGAASGSGSGSGSGSSVSRSPIGPGHSTRKYSTGDAEGDAQHGQGQSPSQGVSSAPGSRSSTPRPGMKTRRSEPHQTQTRVEMKVDTSPGRHARSMSYNQLPLYEEYRQGKRPLTPHEQVLRARLERVLGAGGVAISGSGSGSGMHREQTKVLLEGDCGCDECLGEDERQRERRKRKRESLPAGYGSGRERAGSGSGFFGLGWLWKGAAFGEDESESGWLAEGECGSEPEFINPLPTPSTPPSYQRNPQSQLPIPPKQGVSHSPNSRKERAYTSSNHSKQPQNQSPQRHTPRQRHTQKHVFSLETVPSVGDMRAEFESGSGSASEAEAERSASTSESPTRMAGKNDESSMRMITPPPTPPRRAESVDGTVTGSGSGPGATEDIGASLIRSRSAASRASASGKNGLGLGLGRPSTRRSTTGGSGSGSSTSAASGTSSSERSKSKSKEDGGAVLGLGLVSPPVISKATNGNGNSSSSSGSSTSVSALASASASMESSTSASSKSPSKSHASTKDKNTLSLSSQVLSPNQGGFNARTASAQCRLVEGYVSFAEVEGLGEPPASAHPSVCEEGDYFFEGKERKGFFGLGRIFGGR